MKKLTLLLVVCICTLTLPACSLPMAVLCDVNNLYDRIIEANATPTTVDTLELAAGCVYKLEFVFVELEGNNGLPVITSPIVIHGHGATISRDPENPEQFRLFYVTGPADLTLTDLTLSGGYSYSPTDPHSMANSGGAIFNRGSVTIIKSRLEKNWADNIGEGGAILNLGTLVIQDSTLYGNEDGFNTILGGAALANWGDATITGSTISDNGHFAEQDAIWTQGTLRMTNSTVSGNGWSGIDNEYGDVYLNYVTIANHPSLGMAGSSGHWYVTNSLFAFNERGDCSPNLPLSNPTASNIMDTDGTCGGLTTTEAALLLAPLGNYGGLTATHALGAGSAAIDMVDPSPDTLTHLVPGCIPSDQRGEARPYGEGCDLGAYEFHGEEMTALPALAPEETPTLVPCTFTAAVDLNCRSGPGALHYPAVDNLPAGESARVLGMSPDGLFAYLEAPHIAGTCAVPVDAEYGALTGETCPLLPVFTPIPIPIISLTPEDAASQPGCTVTDLTHGGGIKCIVPCPEGAVPGEPCTP